LEVVGFEMMEVCGDCFCVVLGSLVVGISVDEIIDFMLVIEEIKCCYIGSLEFSNLFCKYKMVFIGMFVSDVVYVINDIVFIVVVYL